MYRGEKFNSITHLVGAALALTGMIFLVIAGVKADGSMVLVSYIVFGTALLLLYLMSTLYHSLRAATAKKVFQKFDHICIYVLIAGTYTPYTLVSLAESNGLRIFLFVWAMAIAGVCMELFFTRRREWLALVLYLSMGWSCLLEFSALSAALSGGGLIWLALGGAAYTIGVVFYVLDDMGKLRHAHGIWHLFVMLGSISHYISIIGFVH